MATKEVPKQSWTALLEHDQIQICLSVDNSILSSVFSSQLFFEQQCPNIAKNLMLMNITLKNVARHRERSSFQPTLAP